jgi:hypothetical protein
LVDNGLKRLCFYRHVTVGTFQELGNIVLFADGGVWHADPRLFDATDVLFFKFKTTLNKPITAADVWRKYRMHNDYSKSKGYTVLRFWEREIKCEIDKCIQIVISQIQTYKKKHTK